MQTLLRTQGATNRYNDYSIFIDAHKEGKLLPPDLPGHVMAALALKAPKSISGQFVNWSDDVCKEFLPVLPVD
jgi:hypothetical protein